MSRSAAPATKSHTPPAPNTAPATKNECHQWSASHMKRHFQCAEQAMSPSMPHQILRLPHDCDVNISTENPCIASANRKTIRTDSEDIRTYPRISEDKIVISHPPLRRPSRSDLGDSFCIEKCNISRSGYLPKCVEVLRLPSNLTKYSACHTIVMSTFQRRIPALLPPIERRFEQIPRISER